MNKQQLSALALAAVMGSALQLAAAPSAQAADMEKCYGISKAGENDCANASGSHSCSGHSTTNYDGGDWKYVATGSCMKMGGQTKAFTGMGKAPTKG